MTPTGYHNIWYVYRVHPHGENNLHRFLVGKFYLDEGGFHVLEDHVGWFSRMANETPAEISRQIAALQHSMYYELVNLEDIRQGRHPELLREIEAQQEDLGPESIFEYHRQGMAEPQTLEFMGGKAYLDGFELNDKELHILLANIQSGSANLSYKQGEPVEKAEEAFMDLTKIEPHLESALSGLRQAVKAGHVDPSVLKSLTREIFTDSMVPTMGNKKAYADFLARPKKGIHIHLDGNDFGAINKTGRGFEAGNDAIRAMGGAIRESLDEAVGRKYAKAFRKGGDEFDLFVPTHEHAALFARLLRSKLEAIPPIDGAHHLSVSMGFGHTPEHAEMALIDAKQAKKAAGYKLGQAKTHVASRVPGFEGIIPTGPEQLHLQPLPESVKPQPAAAPVPASTPQPSPAPGQSVGESPKTSV